MAEITRRRQGEMMRTVFEVLMESETELPARTVIDAVMRRLPPTDYEAGAYESTPGRPRFDKILRFTSVTLVKAGWMQKRKGSWSLTPEGVEAHKRFGEPEAFMQEAKRLYKVWDKGRSDEVVEEIEESDVVEYRTASTTLEEAEESAWIEIRKYLGKLTPYEFQDLVAALLRGMGYYVSWISPPGPDGNIDIVAYVDRLGAEGPRIKVEVKRYNHGTIGVEKLRSFLAVLGQHDIGIYVALEGFTKDAIEAARTDANRRVTLVDGQQLVDLWVEHQDGLDVSDRALLPLRPIWFLAQD